MSVIDRLGSLTDAQINSMDQETRLQVLQMRRELGMASTAESRPIDAFKGLHNPIVANAAARSSSAGQQRPTPRAAGIERALSGGRARTGSGSSAGGGSNTTGWTASISPPTQKSSAVSGGGRTPSQMPKPSENRFFFLSVFIILLINLIVLPRCFPGRIYCGIYQRRSGFSATDRRRHQYRHSEPAAAARATMLQQELL